MVPAEALKRIAFLLERALAPTYRVQAFRNAASAIEGIDIEELQRLARTGGLKNIKGVGKTTEAVIAEALTGDTPSYLATLEEQDEDPHATVGADLRNVLKGDCHTHSEWSDGGSPIIEMAATAFDLGHQYIVLTDHSPRLKVANGLSPERLRRQLEEVAAVNEAFAQSGRDFRVLTGIEVDILEDGAIDQQEDLLAALDVVVASVHSKLRMDAKPMTARMLKAIENPHVDILGHCTGRKVGGDRLRPESEFDARTVFDACRETGTVVEINSRPERKDPPRKLLKQAVAAGCYFAIDTDAHAPGQLDWQYIGCDRGAECGVEAEKVVNTRPAEGLIEMLTTLKS